MRRLTKHWNRPLIWVRSRRCACLVTWFCYHLIAKPGNKPGAPLRILRGGTPPWGVIFHENVNFLFVPKKCKVTHTFHKLICNMWLLSSKPIFWWTILTRQSSVIYVFLPKIKMVSSIQLNIGKFIHITGIPYIHIYIGHVLLNKMIKNWTL